MQGGLDQELESVIVQIGGLELTISARRVGSQESDSAGASSSTAAAVGEDPNPGFRDPFWITRAIENEVLRA